MEFYIVGNAKKGTAKTRLESSIVQKAKIRYTWGFIYSTCWNKAQLGSYIVENAKISTAKVGLKSYIIQKAKIR